MDTVNLTLIVTYIVLLILGTALSVLLMSNKGKEKRI